MARLGRCLWNDFEHLLVRKIFLLALVVGAALSVVCCRPGRDDRFPSLRDELRSYVESCDAMVGVAVVTAEGDTVSVNGDRRFPMMSVYKFPIALAVADHLTRLGSDLGDTVTVAGSSLHRDTYSPMLKVYGDADTVGITVRELLSYALRESDNNASDILFDMCGGPDSVAACISGRGIEGMEIRWSEAQMHADTARCHGNASTPMAMARLFRSFYETGCDSVGQEIRTMLETCLTGVDRLAAPVVSAGGVIGHKTGTGDITAAGRISALNDAGYVVTAAGRGYAVAVFVQDSPYDMERTSAIISDISAMVLNAVGGL